jgi:putative sterol carrier protein
LARFLSPAWAAELDTALRGLELPGTGPEAGPGTAGNLRAPVGLVTVVQEVRDTPDGDVRLILEIGADGVHLRVETPGEGQAPGDESPLPTVTIAVSYADAASLSRGELTPAEALNAGRIRVRGDLSALVAGQEMLVAARSATAGLAASTTY